jgi:hypothetical protein
MKLRMTTGLGALALTLTTIAVTVLPSSAAPARSGGTWAASSVSCAVTWGSLAKADQTPVDAATLFNVRSGRHACFDRLVLDGSSFLRVRYVDQVRADGSGDVVPLRGGARLEIITNTASGAETTNPPYQPANRRELVDVTGYQTFRQVAWAGDFEGQSTIGLGVRARLPFRVFVLPAIDGPPRAVIDVAHHW